MRKIYIKNPNTESLALLLDDFYSRNRQYARNTYLNPECTLIECEAWRRSFEDLLCVANTYFPDTSEEQLMSALREIGMKFYLCSNISKIVFHRAGRYLITKENFLLHNAEDFIADTYLPEQLAEILNKV